MANLNETTEQIKTFKDIEFISHPSGEGLMGRIFFSNGYGVSVVRFKIPFAPFESLRNNYGSYTNNESQWELAVLKGNEKNSSLTYDTPITNDVIGYLSEDDVTEIMKQVQSLPSNQSK